MSMHLRGEVVSVPGHKSVGLSSIPDEGIRRRPHPGLHPSLSGWSINGYLGQPREGKLWEPGCHTGPMSRGKGFLSTTGSRAKETGDERPKPRAAAAYAPDFTFLERAMEKELWNKMKEKKTLRMCKKVK